jgi:hypothetical protein
MNAKEYTLNLDDKPKVRWNHIINDNKKECIKVIDELEKIIMQQVSSTTYNILYYTINYLTPSNCIKYYDELLAISEILNISFDKILIGQLCYEMFAACTSLIYKDDNNNNIFFRTMDWPLESLKDVTIKLTVIKNNKIVYKGITWVGYIGILTGMKPFKYALSINFRKSDGSIYDNVLKILKMNYPISYLCRDLLESDYDYDQVKENFINVELISPCYIILSSLNEACTIIRDPSKCVNIIECEKYLIQTNKDPGNDSTDIMFSNKRNELAKNVLEKNKNILNDLLEYPILNNDTIYYAIMIPSNNVINYCIHNN